MREIIHDHAFTEALEQIGDLRRLDDALAGATWAASTCAEDYPEVVGALRLLRTDPHGGLPPFRILFRIVDEHQVEFLFIQPVPDDS